MNDTFSNDFLSDSDLGYLLENDNDDFMQSISDALDGNLSPGNGSSFDPFNMSMAKHLGENLQDVINDIKAGIQGQTGLSTTSFYTLLILYLSVSIFGISGNSLVLIAVFSKPTMRTAHNYFVGALAVSDLILCVFSMPITLWELLFEQWPFGLKTLWLCRCFASVKVLPLFMSSMAIVAVGWDRYRCIIQSERLPFNTRDAKLICGVMLCFALTAVSPVFTIARIDSLIDFQDGAEMGDILVCRETWTPRIRLIYKLTTCTFQFLLPVLLVMYVNCSIVLRLSSRPPSQHPNLNERRRRINNIIIAVTCVFFFSWLPLNVFQLMHEFGQSAFKFIGLSGNEEVVYGLLHLLGTANACFNPILYGYMNENFRNEYKSIYRRMPWYNSNSINNFHRSVVIQFQGEDQEARDRDVIRINPEPTPVQNEDQQGLILTEVKIETGGGHEGDQDHQQQLTDAETPKSQQSPREDPGLSDSGAFSGGNTSASASTKTETETPYLPECSLKPNSLFLHEAISQMVNNLEECQERQQMAPQIHQFFSIETYV